MAAPTEIRGVQAVPAAEVAALVPLAPGALFSSPNSTLVWRRFGRTTASEGLRPSTSSQASTRPIHRGPGEGLVRAAIVIAEGPRSIVGDVAITGTAAVATDELRSLIKIGSGDAYYEPRAVEARDALLLEYLNRGFASAVVDVRVAPSQDRSRIDITFNVQEGPQTIVDHILIVGNVHTKPDVILRELQFRPGQPLGLQDQFESRRRLSALGLFRRVQITQLTHGSGTEHDVLVTVEEAPATTIGYGGGLEGYTKSRNTGPDGQPEDHFEFAPRGFFDIGRRNLFGANRSVSLYTRVSLRPKDAPDNPELDGTGIGFSEYRVVGTYRQPRWYGANELTVTGILEQGVRTSFNFARKGFNVDVVRRLSPAVRTSGRYSLSSTRTFDERLDEEDQATIDRLFPQVRLSGFSGAVARDTRDDLLEPTRGMFLSGEGTLAARALGGQVGYIKSYVQGFMFHLLPMKKPVVFASRAALGLAQGFEREVQTVDAEGNPETEIVDDLPSSERFFAGGDTSIRGFAARPRRRPGYDQLERISHRWQRGPASQWRVAFSCVEEGRRRCLRRRRQRLPARERVRHRRVARQLWVRDSLPLADRPCSRRSRLQDGSPDRRRRSGTAHGFHFSLGQAF